MAVEWLKSIAVANDVREIRLERPLQAVEKRRQEEATPESGSRAGPSEKSPFAGQYHKYFVDSPWRCERRAVVRNYSVLADLPVVSRFVETHGRSPAAYDLSFMVKPTRHLFQTILGVTCDLASLATSSPNFSILEPGHLARFRPSVFKQ